MLKGIFPPITTPFINDEIAFDKLSENLEKWNKTELSGYVVMGSNGESAFLTRDEKLRLIEEVKKNSSKDKLVIAGTGSDSIKETIVLTNLAANNGADYALILTPSFFKEKMNNISFEKYYTSIADNVDIPVIIYNVPKYTGVNIESPAVAKLADHKNIAGLKSSSENVAHLAEIIYNAGNNFETLVGTASVLYPGLCVGAVGGVLALANIAPDECVKIQKIYESGKKEEALELQCRMIPVNKAVTGKYGVAGLKAALDLRGYFGGEPRSPLNKISEKDLEDLETILSEADLI
ncbi:MAG TPA: dihydrodipicolinate synthase family protein [Ignavibacteriaceae bacterium]|nr:dihydrodipicolinate synthase family protein [Ignavibacteriaceae bacterium]